jgi:hypothetical protein
MMLHQFVRVSDTRKRNGQLMKSRSSDLHVDGGRKGMNEMPNTLIEPDTVNSGYAADR